MRIELRNILALAALALLFYAGAIPADSDNRPTKPVTYDSGWVEDSTALGNHKTVFKHNLGTIPSSMSLWFAPELQENGEPEVVHAKIWPWTYSSTGNPVTISANESEIVLGITANAPLHGYWDPDTSTWVRWYEGYWRVVASP